MILPFFSLVLLLSLSPCSRCTTDAQCMSARGDSYLCSSGGECVHKDLVPLNRWDFAAMTVCFAVAIIAGAGGIGGGVLFVPLLGLLEGRSDTWHPPSDNSV